jgi:hypothetical protein
MLINSWVDFKILVSTKALLMQYMEKVDTYEIFAPEAQTFLWNISLLKNSDDAVDFETNYKASCNQPLEYRSTDGLPKVANALFTDIASYWVDGENGVLSIPAGQTGYVKTHFPAPFKLNGVDVHWSGSNIGDSILFEVGLYTGDISDESTFVPLAQFSNKYRIMGEGTKMFEVPTVKTVSPTYNGLDVYIRTTYVNAGSSNATLLVNLLGYK